MKISPNVVVTILICISLGYANLGNAAECDDWMLYDDFFKSAKLEQVRICLDRGKSPNAVGVDRWTPLHYAVEYSEPGIVVTLVEAGGNVNAENINGETPFHLAARYTQNTEVLSFLFQNGAKDNSGLHGDSVLHYAASYNDNPDVISTLIDLGLEMESVNVTDWTPLLRAAEACNLPAIKILLERGANARARTAYGVSGLHMASTYCGQGVVKTLLASSARRDLNESDINGFTPLHGAAARNSEEVIVLLVESGANIRARSKEGKSPFDLAERRNEFRQPTGFLDKLKKVFDEPSVLDILNP